MVKLSFPVILAIVLLTGCSDRTLHRSEISLNGQWEIVKTDTSLVLPEAYTGKIQVPGLVDMASPPVEILDKVFTDTTTVIRNHSIMFNNSIFWHRRFFTLPEKDPGLVLLKINKACYHTWVYVNGKFAGENVYSFTPTILNIKPFLKEKGVKNELVIAIGSQNNLPDTVTHGQDFEKVNFIPGIYDDVKLILTGYPHIVNVQTAPDPLQDQLRVVAEIERQGSRTGRISYIIRETLSGKIVAKGKASESGKKNDQVVKIDFTASVPGARHWSPEDPFLYDLELFTGADNSSTRFGMRDFRASPDSAVLLLNGKPYYLRGTNVCIGRFFEDSLRADYPWDRKWITRLHQAFKYMHGNSIRYCIGLPPESWYEIADSLGFLIQDEYPIWGANPQGKMGSITTDQLAREYEQWMRERWNHACVVIWDAQNETRSDSIAIAINKVRHLDLTERPWENGWSAPAGEQDVMEAHPYLFYNYYSQLSRNITPVIKEGILKDILKGPRNPGGPNFDAYKGDKPLGNPIVINEYAWFWLNRDGSPTTLTKALYNSFYPWADTPEKRLELYARIQGMKTEYWRAHRKVAGVLEFCGLGYSRPFPPRGQTSDHLVDVANVTLEPNFVKYVRPAFSPVGIMIDFWDEALKPGAILNIPVRLVNDTYDNWKGNIAITLSDGRNTLLTQQLPGEVAALGRNVFQVSLSLPAVKGNYTLAAEIIFNSESVKSLREFRIE